MTFIRSTYRFYALMMAFLVFFSSVGIAVDIHYCGGQLKSISFFGKAKNCHEMTIEGDASMKNCPHHKKMLADKKTCSKTKNCCSNKTILIQSDQDQQIQNSNFVVSKQLQLFVITSVIIFISSDFNVEYDAIPFAHYKPPLIRWDIPILNQSFLL